MVSSISIFRPSFMLDRRDPDYWRDLADRKQLRDAEFLAGKIGESTYLLSLNILGFDARGQAQELVDRRTEMKRAMKYIKTPCAECPWRTDVPTGKFPPERFRKLAACSYDMASTIFACHKSPEGGEFACAGFLLMSSAHNLSVRMAQRATMIQVSSQHPLYPTYRRMAIANGVRASDPSLTRCRDDGQRG